MSFITQIQKNKNALKVLAVLIALVTVFFIGRLTSPPKEIITVIETTKTIDAKTLAQIKTDILKELESTEATSIDKNTSTKSIENAAKATTSKTKVKVTEIDIASGKSTKITETEIDEVETETNIVSTKTDTTVAEKIEETIVETTDTHIDAVVDTTVKVEETSTTTIVEKPAESLASVPGPLGLGLTMKGKPLVTYDVVKIKEIDIKEKDISAIGAAITKAVTKNKRTVVGVYGLHNLDESRTKVGVMIGYKF